MMVPKPRGSLGEAVFAGLTGHDDAWRRALRTDADGPDDLHVTLWALYELHRDGFEDADDDLQWDPGPLAVRRSLEEQLEATLRERDPGHPPTGSIADDLFALVEGHDGRSLADWVRRDATREQVLELLQHRSVYHLREADPASWSIPHLPVAAKAALVELQYDEYGAGDPNRLHAHLFARGMEACGLRPDYGAYVDDAPAEVLEQNNAMSLFGLHRRLRGASMGHLAAFEATSSGPSRRMAQGLERLGLPEELVAYYTEHVEADAVHEQLAARAICGALVEEEPSLAGDVLFGAFTCLDLEDRTARRLLEGWAA